MNIQRNTLLILLAALICTSVVPMHSAAEGDPIQLGTRSSNFFDLLALAHQYLYHWESLGLPSQVNGAARARELLNCINSESSPLVQYYTGFFYLKHIGAFEAWAQTYIAKQALAHFQAAVANGIIDASRGISVIYQIHWQKLKLSEKLGYAFAKKTNIDAAIKEEHTQRLYKPPSDDVDEMKQLYNRYRLEYSFPQPLVRPPSRTDEAWDVVNQSLDAPPEPAW